MLGSLNSLAKAGGGFGGATDATNPMPFATSVKGLVHESLRHSNAICSTGMPPALVLKLLEDVCNASSTWIASLLKKFADSHKLSQWTSFSRGDAPPPKRARQADALVQRVIDPIISEVCTLCQVSNFVNYMNDVSLGIRSNIGKSIAAGNVPPSEIFECLQELVIEVQGLAGQYGSRTVLHAKELGQNGRYCGIGECRWKCLHHICCGRRFLSA